MTMKGFLSVALWALIGIGISQQLEVGTVIESAFPIIWIGVFVIGIYAWNK